MTPEQTRVAIEALLSFLPLPQQLHLTTRLAADLASRAFEGFDPGPGLRPESPTPAPVFDYQKPFPTSSSASQVLSLFTQTSSHTTSTLSSLLPHLSKKQLYNALGFLTRTQRLTQISYGCYTRGPLGPNRPTPPEPSFSSPTP